MDRVFIIGCGTCTTMTKTGGMDQVLADEGAPPGDWARWVTGWTVIPTACDEMTEVSLQREQQRHRRMPTVSWS